MIWISSTCLTCHHKRGAAEKKLFRKRLADLAEAYGAYNAYKL
ncbi:MAG: hypothetical protein ACOX4F_03035 [Atopobiaceae bacterium]